MDVWLDSRRFARLHPLTRITPWQSSPWVRSAVLPSFRLRVFQECSDIYQEIGDQVDVVGGAFRFDRLKNPIYPSDKASSGERDS